LVLTLVLTLTLTLTVTFRWEIVEEHAKHATILDPSQRRLALALALALTLTLIPNADNYT